MTKNIFIIYILLMIITYSSSLIFNLLQDSMMYINLLMLVIYILVSFIIWSINYNNKYKQIIDKAVNIYNTENIDSAYGHRDPKFNRWLSKSNGLNDDIRKEVRYIYNEFSFFGLLLFISFLSFIVCTILFCILGNQF